MVSDELGAEGGQKAAFDMPAETDGINEEGEVLLGDSGALWTLLFFLMVQLVGVESLYEGVLLGDMEAGMETLQNVNGCREHGLAILKRILLGWCIGRTAAFKVSKSA